MAKRSLDTPTKTGTTTTKYATRIRGDRGLAPWLSAAYNKNDYNVQYQVYSLTSPTVI